MMRRFVPALALALVGLNAPFAVAAKSDFRVYNSTGSTMYRLYVSASSLDGWGRDILGSSMLRNGGNTKIRFGDPSPSRCLYDFRAEFANGAVVQDMQVDVCDNSWIQFR
jgi:hypothetical protein